MGDVGGQVTLGKRGMLGIPRQEICLARNWFAFAANTKPNGNGKESQRAQWVEPYWSLALGRRTPGGLTLTSSSGWNAEKGGGGEGGGGG